MVRASVKSQPSRAEECRGLVKNKPDRLVLEEIYVLLLSPTKFIALTFVRKL